jgi:cytochrome c biogenesis protein CcmG, thiol:disulfide interchange protein DsbE
MTFRTIPLALGALLALTGCADPALNDRVAQMEEKIEALEQKVEEAAKAPRGAGGAPQVDQAAENEARAFVGQIQQAVSELEFDKAKERCEKGESEYGATRTWRRAGRVCREVEVVGKDAADLEVEKWFQGEGTSMADKPATLLVFWEEWCPHCKREVPKIESTYKKYGDRLNVVGLTKVTRSATDEKVAEFISQEALSYPVAKEKGGNLSNYYNVSGVPAAALVKDGKVIWRGHPARLEDQTLEQLL